MDDVKKIAIRAAQVTLSACDGNPTAIAKVPIMATRITVAKGLVSDVIDADQLAMIDMSGLADQKEATRELLTTEILFGYDVIGSLADETNDLVLKKMVHYPESALDEMGGADLLEVGQNLKAKVTELTVPVLVPHGYEVADETALTDTLIKFEKQINQPESEIKDHGLLIIDRNQKYHKMLTYFKNQLDSAAKPLRKKDPMFYILYKKCRKLHLQGHRGGSGSEGGGEPGEFDIKVPALKIVPIPFKILEGKIYLFANLGDGDLVYWTQATPDAPATVPAEKWKIVGGDEAVRNSIELGYPDKVFLFVANESNEVDGEIAIDEVI
jgi:hypothetical protein